MGLLLAFIQPKQKVKVSMTVGKLLELSDIATQFPMKVKVSMTLETGNLKELSGIAIQFRTFPPGQLNQIHHQGEKQDIYSVGHKAN